MYATLDPTRAASTAISRSSSQARTSALVPAATGSGEDRAQRGADRVRVEQVGARVGHDHGVGARRIRGAQHGAEVARLLDRLEDDDERVRPEVERGERLVRDRDDRHEPLGAVAVREPGEHGAG